MIPNFSGIYEIRCTVTDKVYVGSAVWIAKRWRHHRESLRRKIHGNSLLQRAWDKYGEHAFEFSVIAACEKEELLKFEQRAIDEMMAADRRFGFNLNPVAGSNLGRKFSPEQRARMSKSRMGIRLSEGHKAVISARMMGNQHLRGHVHGAETLKKLSEVSKRNYPRNAGNLIYPKTPEQRAQVGARFRGKPLSETHRAKIATSRMGHVNTPEQLAKFAKSRRVLTDEKLARMRELRASGATQAAIAEQLGCSTQTICNALRGKGYE